MDDNYNSNFDTDINANEETNANAEPNAGAETNINAAINTDAEESINAATNTDAVINNNAEVNSGTETVNADSSGSLYSYSYINKEEKKSREKKKNFCVTLAKCAAIALVFGLVSGSVFYGVNYAFGAAFGNNSTPAISQSGSGNNKVTTTNTSTKAVVSDISDMVDEVMPSIVSITSLSVQEIQTWFGQTYRQETPSAGSGIIVAQTDSELYIVTNNHVVSGATTLSVTFVDDESISAEIKGTDSGTDLAVITVEINDIPEDTLNQIKIATLGNSGNIRVGEPAIAIGNALGYGQSVTTGVISALDREVTVTDSNNNSVTNSLIQTDAAINPGNSGGALLNIDGEVIGINSVKYSDTDVEGMGYAIPISTAEPIINDLITREVVDESEMGYLGITGVDVTDEISEYHNLPKGISVYKVESGSAAEKAGIKKGDIIIAFDGREVLSMDALAERIQYYAAGTTVDVTVMRAQDGEYVEKVIPVTLGKKK